MKYFIAAIAAAALAPFVSFAAECPNLSRTLSFGARGNDVVSLQRFLIGQGHLASGNDSGYFGRLTESAVRRFQCKEMGLCQGSVRENGYGAVGPRTRTRIAAVCAGTTTTPTPAAERTTPTAPTPQASNPQTDQPGPSQSQEMFSAFPLTGDAPLEVTFFLNAAPDPSAATRYVIDFGDGRSGDATGCTLTGRVCTKSGETRHTYASPGTYATRLLKVTQNTCQSVPGIDCPAWHSREDQVSSLTLNVTPRVETNQRPSPLAPTQMRVLLSGLREMYAPSVYSFGGRKRMVLGGWLTDANRADYVNAIAAGASPDAIYGPDKIFYSEWDGSQWTAPVLAFRKLGAHVNDGTVVAPPSDGGTDRSQWRYMYYTILKNSIAVGPQSEWFQNHEVGLASSVDGGRTWTDVGTVILPQEAGDGRGAWAPGAIVVGNEIWVYYRTGTNDFSQPIMFRQKFHANGWQKLGAAERLQFPSDGVVHLSNVDVSRQGSTNVLLGNSLDLKNVERYISSDGISWRRDPRFTNPLMGGGAPLIITPHADVIDDRTFDVYFGWNPDGAISESHSIHAWRFILPQ
jgi:peptidoglycan hydrolase-like protein with peptidoglycan-binding domain